MNGTFVSLLLLLMVAVTLVWAFRRLKLPAILAYLCAGIIVGPDVTGWIASPDDYHFIAELGIVLLLFSLGLEFSLPKMLAMRRWVFALGGLQVALCGALFFAILYWLTASWMSALVMSGALALSSTAVVIKQLKESGQTSGRRGQMAVAVLLFQDLAVVPLLIIIPLLAQHSAEGIWQSLGWALGKGIAVILVLLAIGKWVLPTVFKEVAKQRTDELFVLATLMVALLAGGLTYAFGLSMALGAFLAGMMLGESQYRHQLEADIRPFRDILMGLFFTTIGMQLPLAGFASQLHWVLAGLTLMALIKILVIRWLAKQLGEKPINAWGSAIALFQMGEFGFVIVSLAVAQGILAQQYATIMVGIGVFSMAITPSIIQRLDGLLARCFTARSEFPDIEEQVTNQPQPAQAAVICGFGRVGQTVSRFLQAEGIAHIAVDSDPLRVHEAIAGGAPVYYGDSSKRDILKAVGVESAPLVIISFADDLRAIEVLRVIRQLNNEAYVIVRSRDDLRLQQLQEAGASQVVPDTLEASLMLISQILSRSGVPIRRILARLEQERRNHYGDMHGFYPGETTDMAPEKLDKLEFLHAVTLTDNAYAVDKPLLQLGLDERGVAVKALRREGVEIDEPAYQIRLQANDVVLLSGKPQAVEAAENYLLEG